MNPQLLLSNIRTVLMRLEETIIFDLIERAQFRQNACIYAPEFFGEATVGDSLLRYLLRETESVHARMRRYTSPDEKPFSSALPAPILPRLRFEESPVDSNSVNLNPRILSGYIARIVPLICEDGDDGQYGSSAVADVNCLQNLSHRIHYGMFVAESKFRSAPAHYQNALREQDKDKLYSLVTNAEVEEQLLKRVAVKARHYGQDVNEKGAERSGPCKISPDTVRDIYRDWIIPLTKEMEVDYLLECKGRTA